MKCFLSHSSSDKASYVSMVANKLGPNIEFDEKTFEEGMENFEEIMRALGRSDIFVLFISDASLGSEWVKKEIIEAKKLLDVGDIKRFFPIIIERGITHKDPRIPDWLRDQYNLKPITKPVVAARRIRERLLETSWETHPLLKERDQIFVGRNSFVSDFEQRFDDFNRDQPLVVIASGLREIGRKSTILHCLGKANLVRNTYAPIRIDLSDEDGIEGLIVKLADIGLSEQLDTSNLLTKTAKEKRDLCVELIRDLHQCNEILMIEDHYCIVRSDREIASWFVGVVDALGSDGLGICVASSSKVHRYKYIQNDKFYFMEIPELQKHESEGLFRRFVDHLNLVLSRNDFKNFAPLLKGYPEQVTYAANLIKELGACEAFKKSHEIASFSTFKASIFIQKYEGDTEALSFLRFICSFDFVSVDFIEGAAQNLEKSLVPILGRFVTDSVCEPIGSSGQYFRVNEVIRDAIIRDKTTLSDEYRDFLHGFVEKFTKDYLDEYYDVSEYHIAIKEALLTGVEISESLLIPAHFLKTLKGLYSAGRHRDVVSLADRVLLRAESYDNHTSQDIRYYLCQSLARLRDDRFVKEVQQISGPEHQFLFGFYYRLKGQYDKSIERYKDAINFPRTEQRARRELVFVMTKVEAYVDALSWAKENYERYPSNPFLVQAYYECLSHAYDLPDQQDKLQDVLSSMESIRGARANEMHDVMSAKFEYQFGDKKRSFEMIERAISEYKGVVYPILAALDMAIGELDASAIRLCVRRIENGKFGSGHNLPLLKAKVMLMAIEGDKERAERAINRELRQLNSIASERLLNRIHSL